MSTKNPYSSKKTWAAALLHAFNGPDDEIEEAFLALYNKHTVFNINGETYSFEKFLVHVASVRNILANFKIESHCFLRDGNMFAEKHTLTATRKEDGMQVGAEGYVFGELDGGSRAIWVDEQARTLQL
ncbi:hypothetical protein QBC47DRAFT_395852 [Echria macrotheca]|uniref:SnoaL-like domain-containing protein n=1 Tax=Echria macrotheca TaxID=438768 RepID=A0AAJ0B0M5_9PEZI|nr:hypothetical protein QBC47DRAFT_395852 [Echria macrotheca]